MNALMTTERLTMSSREIADLTRKKHYHVLADIDKMLIELEIDCNEVSGEYKDSSGKTNRCYYLTRDLTDCLLTGYSAKLRMVVIQRWRELESNEARPANTYIAPSQKASAELEGQLKAASLLGVSTHYAQIEAVKYVRDSTGVDYSPLLLHAPAQNNIKPEETLLEPTELGKRHGMSAIALNRLLADHGYQRKEGKVWEPTELGKSYCEKHAWSKKAKSGYNLKWRVDLVDTLLAEVAA